MGLTLIICTYNGSKRLEATLSHIKAIEAQPGDDWELIVVDNASTDGTSEAAERLLKDSGVNYRILEERKAGKSHALETGMKAVRTEYVSIVDDDNWLSPDWVDNAHTLFRENPDIGIIGSLNEATFDGEPPEWFDRAKNHYACGPQSGARGRTTEEDPIGYIWGAGMTFRKAIWDRLMEKGFWFISECLRGKRPASGEDLEFCGAASRLGAHLMYSDQLRMKHYMPPGRLNWEYFLQMMRAQGRGYLAIDPYLILRQANNELSWLKSRWYWRALARLKRFRKFPLKYALFPNSIPEGDVAMAKVELEIGCISQILRERSRYTAYIKQVQQLS